MNEFVLYAVLAGAISYGFIWAISKDIALSYVSSTLAGIVCVLFFFPDPQVAKDLGDAAQNLALLLKKGLWILGWVVGTLSSTWFSFKLGHN